MDFISRQNVNAEKSHQNCYSGLCYAKPLKIFTVICVQIRVVSSTFDFQRGKDLGGLIPRTSSKEITVLSWWENVTNLNIICLFTLYGGVTISTLHLWGKYCHCIIVFLLYFFFINWVMVNDMYLCVFDHFKSEIIFWNASLV